MQQFTHFSPILLRMWPTLDRSDTFSSSVNWFSRTPPLAGSGGGREKRPPRCHSVVAVSSLPAESPPPCWLG